MPTRSYGNVTRVSAPPETLYAFFSRPESYIGFQPFVVAVAHSRVGVDPDGVEYIDYTLVERLPLPLGLRFNTASPVRMRFTQPGREIVQDVRAALGVRVYGVLSLTPDGSGTRLQETLDLAAPGLLLRYVAARAYEAMLYRHAELGHRFD